MRGNILYAQRGHDLLVKVTPNSLCGVGIHRVEGEQRGVSGAYQGG